MTRARSSLPPEYFDELYGSNPDPWRFASSGYEAEKYAATMAALPAKRFSSVLELGCSIGVMTNALAARCDDLLAVDVSDVALRQARERCAALAHVSFANMQVPDAWPHGTFDLILASEILYFLDAADIDRVANRLAGSLQAGGTLLLVHWVGLTDYPMSGDDAVGRLITALGLAFAIDRQHRTDDYRLDVLTRV